LSLGNGDPALPAADTEADQSVDDDEEEDNADEDKEDKDHECSEECGFCSEEESEANAIQFTGIAFKKNFADNSCRFFNSTFSYLCRQEQGQVISALWLSEALFCLQAIIAFK
jgi:hypothetical protein